MSRPFVPYGKSPAELPHLLYFCGAQWVYEGHKFCSNCGAGEGMKPLSAFSAHAGMTSGYQSWCRECKDERTRRWRLENRDRLAEERRLPKEERACKLPGCNVTFLTARPVGLHDYCCKAHQRKASKQRERERAAA